MQTPLSSRLRRRFTERFHGAMTFAVATAWLAVMEEGLRLLTGDREGLVARTVHAVCITIVAVLMTLLTDDTSHES